MLILCFVENKDFRLEDVLLLLMLFRSDAASHPKSDNELLFLVVLLNIFHPFFRDGDKFVDVPLDKLDRLEDVSDLQSVSLLLLLLLTLLFDN